MDYVALGAAAVALVALLVAGVTASRLAALRSSDAARPARPGLDELGPLREEVQRLRDSHLDAVKHVAVVRYDAFGDMGGRMSFSAALLDDTGTGLVLTSINGRSETRTYAKGLRLGSSDSPLSPEEDEAITHARNGTTPPDLFGFDHQTGQRASRGSGRPMLRRRLPAA